MVCNRKKIKGLHILIFFIASLIIFHKVFASDISPFIVEDKAPICQQNAKSQLITLPNGARISERIFGLPGLSNVGMVSPAIYRGAQPLPEGYVTLKKMGIKTVINLRTSKNEKDAVEKAGMKSIEVPFSVLEDVDAAKVNKVIDMMTDPNNQPVYVHCRQGQDRTGIIIAAYRLKVEGWPLSLAEAEMQAYGFNDLWHKLKEFIREYAKTIEK